jgi:hypothetical protein
MMDQENVLINNGILFTKKKIEILSCACNWIERKKINSSDVSQVQRAKGTYFLSDM